MKLLLSIMTFVFVFSSCAHKRNKDSLSKLIGKQVSEIKLFDGEYDLIPCSKWPSRYEVVTFKDKSISVVVDKSNENTLVYADSSELSACDYTRKLKNEQVKSMFNPINGSHIKLVSLVKDSMNKPQSFEHMETKYGLTYESDTSAEEYIFVYMKYLGNNGPEKIGAKMSISGEIFQTYKKDSLITALKEFEQNKDASLSF